MHDLQKYIDAIVRRYPPQLRDDLRQSAWVTAVELDGHEPAYVRRAVCYACKTFLRNEFRFQESPSADPVVIGGPDSEVWSNEVREVLSKRCRRSKTEYVGVCYLGELETLQALQNKHMLSRNAIYNSANQTKKRLKQSFKLRQLWEERP